MKIKEEKINKESKTQGLIQFLGDITVKSVAAHEMETSKEGINGLVDIAIKFLELKVKNEKVYKVNEDAPFFKTKQENQYGKYVLTELENIFNETISQRDSTTSRYLIMKLFGILDKVMVGKDNWAILTNMIETRNVRGSVYSELLRKSLENKLTLECELLTRHLVDIPQFAVFERKYIPQYVAEFINYHIYRMTKIIIYANNFEAFSSEMDHFFNTLTFRDPIETASRISGSMYTHGNLGSDNLKKLEELAFGIEKLCLKNFNHVFKIYEKLDEYNQTLFGNRIEPNPDGSQTQLYIDRLKKQLNDYYISLLVHGVFFKIGALIISMTVKNSSYAQYIEELWYHAKPISASRGMNLNSTPISDSIEWTTLYTMYSGVQSPELYDFYMFEDFPDAELYHYQYCALMMIRTGNVFSFDIPKMEKIKSESGERFQYYYELASIMDVQKFIDAVKQIEKNKDLCSIIRVADLSKNIKNVKEKLKQLQEDQKKIINMFARHGELNSGKIDEVKKQFVNKYLDGSIADKISIIKYDSNLESNDLITKENVLGVRRDFFIDQGFSSGFLLDPAVSELSILEMNEILKVIQSKIEPIHQDTLDFVEQIKSNVKLLIQEGKKPNVIFLPLDMEVELWNSGLFDYGKKRKITVDDTELYIVNSWNRFDFTDIIIFDSTCLTITYKAETQDKRMDIHEYNTEAGKDQVLFSCKIAFLTHIADVNGFKRIINQNVTALKAKNENNS